VKLDRAQSGKGNLASNPLSQQRLAETFVEAGDKIEAFALEPYPGRQVAKAVPEQTESATNL
jgi:hypothetical protein